MWRICGKAWCERSEHWAVIGIWLTEVELPLVHHRLAVGGSCGGEDVLGRQLACEVQVGATVGGGSCSGNACGRR